MKRISYTLASLSLFALPFAASAQLASQGGDGGEFQTFLSQVLEFVNSTLIPFIIGIGFLVFVWGMFWYFIAGGADEDKRDKGRNLMIYAVLGFVLIVVFWGVINLIANSLFRQGDTDRIDQIPVVEPVPRGQGGG